MNRPKVFVSYSHDSLKHSERVLNLAWALQGNGIDVELDQFHNEEIVDWPRWCNEQISREHSDFVLCVCSAEYKRRIDGNVPPQKGKGVYWEGSFLDDDIYDEKGNRRIIPVLFDDEPDTSIVRFLRGWTHCRMETFALEDSGYEHLLRILTRQARVEKKALGELPKLPTKRAPGIHPSRTFDLSRILKYAPPQLIGRDDEKKILSDAWGKVVRSEADRPSILTFVALGGEGKTSLVTKWVVDELRAIGWPGCDAAFAWSFYSQGTREQLVASSDLFLKEALTFFGDDADRAFAASPAGAFEKGQHLARLVGERRSLLILDGLEPLQYAPTAPMPGELKDQGIAALLKGLAAASHGLCIVTTRYSLPDLQAFWQTTALEVRLLRLSRDAGVHLLKTLGVKGSELRNLPLKDHDQNSEKVNEFEKLVEDVKGHALTLSLLGGFLSRAFHGDIRQRDRVKFEKADEKMDGGHAFRTMAAYEQWLSSGGDEGRRELAVLRLMGLFDRPADAGCLAALRREPIPGLTEALAGLADDDWEYCLSGLEAARLLTVNRDAAGTLLALDTHPHIREYFAKQVREGARWSRFLRKVMHSVFPRLTMTTRAWRAAHRRLYRHLCASTPDKPEPTLEDLQPLYQAVAHGCQADLQQEVCRDLYEKRIRRGDEAYSTKKLGAFGSDLAAMACFFERVWSIPSFNLIEERRGWLLNQVGFSLRAQGRIKEALEALELSVTIAVDQEDWKQAARRANNVSESQLILGNINSAKAIAEQAVAFADRNHELFERMAFRTTYADCLHQAADNSLALGLFRKAESLQMERDGDHPLLYSIQGFRYCEFLLSDVERQSWSRFLRLESQSNVQRDRSTLIETRRRIEQIVSWANLAGSRLLALGLAHLALSRLTLYLRILGFEVATDVERNIRTAVENLRDAGQIQELPRGLLTRAWLRLLKGNRTGPDSAQSDLDEAWEIAERGPMRLHMADIHLHRARLFFTEATYPWESPQADLAGARKLIEQCGYGRRKAELEDAEAVLKQQRS